ncbi:hypothetical protein UYO_2384 [Lachnospiraceae bacterium JC7]|nr:hypothetical protein UYO_2384 [Lachnospiraceae bacterium JC7]
MFKKTIMILLVGTITLTAAGCSTKVNAMENAKNIPVETAPSSVDSSSDTITDSIVGGWTVSEDAQITDDVNNAFEKAISGLTGVQYEPIACLGTQVVAGTNYCILCKATPVIPDSKSYYTLMYVYESLDSKAEIAEFKDIELGY